MENGDKVRRVRWDELFADLEAQFEAEEEALRSSEVSDRTRREVARLGLLDRLRGALGTELRVVVDGAGVVTGRLVDLGCDWLLLRDGGSREAFVRISAVLTVRGLTAQSLVAEPHGPVVNRLDIRYVLRALAQNRSAVVFVLVDGTRLPGTVGRVGADFVEFAEHSADYRAPADGRHATHAAVPLGALAMVWRR